MSWYSYNYKTSYIVITQGGFYLDTLFDFFMDMGFNSSISKVISFFIFETAYLSILLGIGIFIFTFIRVKFLNDDLVQKLETKPKVVVYLGMALLGIISPFCSCSTIPVFVSFVALGVPTGGLFIYLITSPLVQETSIILLLAEFGFSVTILYIVFGVTSGMIVGVLLSKTKDSELFTSEVLEKRKQKNLSSENEETCDCSSMNKDSDDTCCSSTNKECGDSCCSESIASTIDPRKNPVAYARTEAFQTLRNTYKYILIGIGFGSLIYGVVPPSAIENLLGANNNLAPILATLVGIPIYADDVALIPVAKTLIDSGAGLGTALSFVMSSAVVSLPSFIMLAGVLKKKTLIKLAVILTIAIIIIGYTFNILQPYII